MEQKLRSESVEGGIGDNFSAFLGALFRSVAPERSDLTCLGLQINGEESVASGRHDEGEEADPDPWDLEHVQDSHPLPAPTVVRLVWQTWNEN